MKDGFSTPMGALPLWWFIIIMVGIIVITAGISDMLTGWWSGMKADKAAKKAATTAPAVTPAAPATPATTPAVTPAL